MKEKKMIEELKEEELIEKCGGRFKLSVLIQKRLVNLNRGGKPFVMPREGESTLQIVIREILEDKIFLNLDGESSENAFGNSF